MQPLGVLVRLGLVRDTGVLLVPNVDPLRACFREFIRLAKEHSRLDYAKQRLRSDPLNVTSNIASYCLLRKLREAGIELEEAKLARLTVAYLTLLWETGALLYLEWELARAIEEVEGKALNQPRCNCGS